MAEKLPVCWECGRDTYELIRRVPVKDLLRGPDFWKPPVHYRWCTNCGYAELHYTGRDAPPPPVPGEGDRGR